MSGENTKYSVVVVGLGKRGMHHAEAFANNGRFELVGLCDIDKDRLDAASRKLGGPKTATDAKVLMQGLRPDVFCFCTLPQLRLDMVRLGVDSGAGLIAFEKPVALSTNEALQVMKLVREAKVKTVVSHQHRYGEHYKKVKEIIASGAIGRVHTVYGTATGWMMHMLTHLIEYVRWFNDYAEAEWAVGQAAGKEKFADNHPSPDYVA
ncbi:MAG TPA: Gfo/Idh/MocA family oxidoreductase, partial [Terriglobia bacterium]|nr:Gfo/Idh/MocA family oxidoreductase [Terriglobia bacterium]